MRVVVQMLLGGFAVVALLLLVRPSLLEGRPSTGEILAQSALSLVGVSGPVQFRVTWFDDLTAVLGLTFGIAALVLGGYFLLRSAEPRRTLTDDDAERIRALLARHGRADSLGYFALRPDKAVVFSPSGKAAVPHRVVAGVALASGDPLGDVEAWPGAITEFLASCRRYGWVPAVLGCSEAGARVWAREGGLDALELGDEAVVDVADLLAAGPLDAHGAPGRLARPARGLRHHRAAPVRHPRRRARAAPRARRPTGAAARPSGASRWRSRAPPTPRPTRTPCWSSPPPRGRRAGCSSSCRGAPTACRSTSWSATPRCPTTASTSCSSPTSCGACRGLEVDRVSLNFAVFRSALERGEKIGAGPVARLWARLLRTASRWWQIETLYRFNARFGPVWVPRYLVFDAVRDLPRIAVAAFEAEGYGGRPPALLRLLRR